MGCEMKHSFRSELFSQQHKETIRVLVMVLSQYSTELDLRTIEQLSPAVRSRFGLTRPA